MQQACRKRHSHNQKIQKLSEHFYLINKKFDSAFIDFDKLMSFSPQYHQNVFREEAYSKNLKLIQDFEINRLKTQNINLAELKPQLNSSEFKYSQATSQNLAILLALQAYLINQQKSSENLKDAKALKISKEQLKKLLLKSYSELAFYLPSKIELLTLIKEEEAALKLSKNIITDYHKILYPQTLDFVRVSEAYRYLALLESKKLTKEHSALAKANSLIDASRDALLREDLKTNKTGFELEIINECKTKSKNPSALIPTKNMCLEKYNMNFEALKQLESKTRGLEATSKSLKFYLSKAKAHFKKARSFWLIEDLHSYDKLMKVYRNSTVFGCVLPQWLESKDIRF